MPILLFQLFHLFLALPFLYVFSLINFPSSISSVCPSNCHQDRTSDLQLLISRFWRPLFLFSLLQHPTSRFGATFGSLSQQAISYPSLLDTYPLIEKWSNWRRSLARLHLPGPLRALIPCLSPVPSPAPLTLTFPPQLSSSFGIYLCLIDPPKLLIFPPEFL